MFPSVLIEYCNDVNTVMSCLKVSKEINLLFRNYLLEITSDKPGYLKLGSMHKLQKISDKINLLSVNLNEFPEIHTSKLLLNSRNPDFPKRIENILKSFNIPQKIIHNKLTLYIPEFYLLRSGVFGRKIEKISLQIVIHNDCFELIPSSNNIYEKLCDYEDPISTIIMSIIRRIVLLHEKIKIKITHKKLADFICESKWVSPDQMIIQLAKPKVKKYNFFMEDEPNIINIGTMRVFTGGETIYARDINSDLLNTDFKPNYSDISL